MLGDTLTIVLPAVILAYGVWLVVCMIRRRKKGGGFGSCGGCAGCPYAGSCQSGTDCRLPPKETKHD